MESISTRIQTCVQVSGLTKTAFAQRINVGQSFVSQLCTGRSKPSDRTITDICREFNVSETWLRTGEGEMFRETPDTLTRKLAQSFGLDELGSQIISAYLKLDERDRLAVGRLIENLIAERGGGKLSAPAVTLSVAPPPEKKQLSELVDEQDGEPGDAAIKAEARKKADAYYEQLLLEASTGTSGASTPAKTG